MRLQGNATTDAATPRQLYIHRLHHARAPILANTLSQLFGGGVIRTGSAAQAAATLSQQLRIIEQQSAIRQQAGLPNQPNQIVVPQIRAGDLEGPVTIVPDEVTNSLLVRATPADWQVIQQAIVSLDLRPLQVVIEVVIAEVRHTNDLNVGLSVNATNSNGEWHVDGRRTQQRGRA